MKAKALISLTGFENQEVEVTHIGNRIIGFRLYKQIKCYQANALLDAGVEMNFYSNHIFCLINRENLTKFEIIEIEK